MSPVSGPSALSPVSAVATVQPVAMFDVNPLTWLGEQAKEGLADGFTSMMMGLWSAAMWLLKTAFALIDNFTPNVQDPDLNKLYGVTLWIGLLVALTVAFGQIGLAVLRQDGRGFGTLLAGLVQYGVVVAGWITVCAATIAGTSGLTKAILSTLLGVDSFSGYAAGDGFVDTVSGTVQSATLGVCALFIVIPAAFGHIIILMVRSAALLLLTATMPIAAAGALSEGTKAWMWKSIRWFLACALMEPLLALVLGLGTQFAWAGMPDGTAAEGSSTAQNIGVSVVGSVILLVACFTPLALFRLLAFVDPGTASGASFRATMSANGGVSGLLKGGGGSSVHGGGGHEAHGSGAATQTGRDGRTSSESGADAQTAARFQSGAAKKVASRVPVLGRGVGGTVAGAMSGVGKLAQAGASMGVDVLGQSGIGNQGYYDLSHSPRQAGARNRQAHRMQPFDDTNHDGIANDTPAAQAHPQAHSGAHPHAHSQAHPHAHSQAHPDIRAGGHAPPAAEGVAEDAVFLA